MFWICQIIQIMETTNGFFHLVTLEDLFLTWVAVMIHIVQLNLSIHMLLTGPQRGSRFFWGMKEIIIMQYYWQTLQSISKWAMERGNWWQHFWQQTTRKTSYLSKIQFWFFNCKICKVWCSELVWSWWRPSVFHCEKVYLKDIYFLAP